jgi:hypothetical protein
MLNNSLQMIKIDQNMSDLWQILCKKNNFSISAFIGFIVQNVYYCTNMNNFKISLPYFGRQWKVSLGILASLT